MAINLYHKAYSGFFPWNLQEVSGATLASYQASGDFLVDVPLPQICKWYWLTKTGLITGASTFTIAGGSDSVSAVTAVTTLNYSIFNNTWANIQPENRVAPFGVTAFSKFNPSEVDCTASATGTSSLTGGGTYNFEYLVTLFVPFNNPGGFSVTPVIKSGGLYYPSLQLIYHASNPVGGATIAGATTSGAGGTDVVVGFGSFDGVSLPLYAPPSFGLTSSLTITLDSLWN